jgi:hypothetical protein
MILKKLLVMFWNLFFPPIIYKEKKIIKEPCWKHEAFKKGCPTCRGMNA